MFWNDNISNVISHINDITTFKWWILREMNSVKHNTMMIVQQQQLNLAIIWIYFNEVYQLK